MVAKQLAIKNNRKHSSIRQALWVNISIHHNHKQTKNCEQKQSALRANISMGGKHKHSDQTQQACMASKIKKSKSIASKQTQAWQAKHKHGVLTKHKHCKKT
jgi:hypothetical protein